MKIQDLKSSVERLEIKLVDVHSKLVKSEKAIVLNLIILGIIALALLIESLLK